MEHKDERQLSEQESVLIDQILESMANPQNRIKRERPIRKAEK